MVPDMSAVLYGAGTQGAAQQRTELFEFKTLHFSPASLYYNTINPGGATLKRAAYVSNEYQRRARDLDVAIFNINNFNGNGPKGPFETRLGQFPLRAFVFGSFGEASEDVYAYIKTVAEMAAPRERPTLTAGDEKAARAILVHLLTQRVGFAAARAHAMLLHNRVALIRKFVPGQPGGIPLPPLAGTTPGAWGGAAVPIC